MREVMTPIRLVYKLRADLEDRAVSQSVCRLVEEQVNSLSQIEFSWIKRMDGVIWDDIDPFEEDEE